MAAIRKLIQAGMKLIAENQEQIKELTADQKEGRKEIRELRAAQRVTETKLQGLIDALRGRNGGSGRKPH